MPEHLLMSFHFQNWKRISCVVKLIAFEHLEPHVFVESTGVRILFIDIDRLYVQFIKCQSDENLTQSLPETVRMEK